MRRAVRLYMTLITLAILAGTAILMEYAGARRMITAGTVLSILLGAIWVASRFGWVEKTLGRICLFLMLASVALTVLGSQNLLQRTVPFCGDDVCGATECRTGCADCTPEDCEDGHCVAGFEDCSSSPDCACVGGSVCDPGRNQTDVRGCAPVQCGDGFCDEEFEDRFNCCRDCGCLPDYECENNICFFRQPRMTFSPYIVAEEISVTSLAANPQLRNESGTHPLMAITLRVQGSEAENVRVAFSLGDMLRKDLHLGTVRPGQERHVLWYLEHEPSLLAIDRPLSTNLTITVTYEDRLGNTHRNDWVYGMTLLGRNTLDRFGDTVFFVTPQDVTMTGTPRQIWDAVRGDVRLGDTNGTQFPLETLERGIGSAEDIAVLLASAYVSAGKRTSLVKSDYGLFVRVWDGRNYIILDPAKIDRTFASAQATRPGYDLQDLTTYWDERNATQLSVKAWI